MGFGKTIFGPKGAGWRCRRYARSIIVSAIKGPYHGLNSAGVILSAGRFRPDIWQPHLWTHTILGIKNRFFFDFPKNGPNDSGTSKMVSGAFGGPKQSISGQISLLRPYPADISKFEKSWFLLFFDDFGIFWSHMGWPDPAGSSWNHYFLRYMCSRDPKDTFTYRTCYYITPRWFFVKGKKFHFLRIFTPWAK